MIGMKYGNVAITCLKTILELYHSDCHGKRAIGDYCFSKHEETAVLDSSETNIYTSCGWIQAYLTDIPVINVFVND